MKRPDHVKDMRSHKERIDRFKKPTVVSVSTPYSAGVSKPALEVKGESRLAKKQLGVVRLALGVGLAPPLLSLELREERERVEAERAEKVRTSISRPGRK